MNKIEEEAKLRDAMRGVMWEEKYRGTLSEYTSPEILEVGARRWLQEEGTPSSPSPGWEGVSSVGWGTYRWKYDPRLIEVAIEGGAGLIDTAEGYGYGKVEKELGRFLKSNPLGTTWIASKVARNHLSHAATLSAGRRSRDNLGVPIDLYQIHWPVSRLLPYTLDALATLREEGTIRRVGVCNFCAGQLAMAIRLAGERGFRIESNQVRLNLSDRGAIEYLIPRCREIGIRVLIYSPFAQGGLVREGVESLRWVLSQEGVDLAITGTNNVEHLRENLREVCKNTPSRVRRGRG